MKLRFSDFGVQIWVSGAKFWFWTADFGSGLIFTKKTLKISFWGETLIVFLVCFQPSDLLDLFALASSDLFDTSASRRFVVVSPRNTQPLSFLPRAQPGHSDSPRCRTRAIGTTPTTTGIALRDCSALPTTKPSGCAKRRRREMKTARR